MSDIEYKPFMAIPLWLYRPELLGVYVLSLVSIVTATDMRLRGPRRKVRGSRSG